MASTPLKSTQLGKIRFLTVTVQSFPTQAHPYLLPPPRVVYLYRARLVRDQPSLPVIP